MKLTPEDTVEPDISSLAPPIKKKIPKTIVNTVKLLAFRKIRHVTDLQIFRQREILLDKILTVLYNILSKFEIQEHDFLQGEKKLGQYLVKLLVEKKFSHGEHVYIFAQKLSKSLECQEANPIGLLLKMRLEVSKLDLFFTEEFFLKENSKKKSNNQKQKPTENEIRATTGCFYCHGPHLKKDCLRLKKRLEAQGCSICKGSHLKKDCPTNLIVVEEKKAETAKM